MRNQPITRVRAKLGVELDRKRARDETSGRRAEERRHCCSQVMTWRRKCVVSAAQLERRDLRQVKESGRSKGFWRVAEGGDCVILSLVCP